MFFGPSTCCQLNERKRPVLKAKVRKNHVKIFSQGKKGAGEASLTFSPRTDLEGLMEAKTWCTARRPDLQEGAWTGVRLLGEENS